MLRFHDSETKQKSRKIRRRIWLCYIASRVQMFTFFVFALAAPHIGYAAIFRVNSTADMLDASPGDGFCDTGRKVPPPQPPSQPATPECTLRAAIAESNALQGKDVINLPAGTYVLTLGGSLRILGDLSLKGENTDTTTIRSNAVVGRDSGGNIVSITGGSGIFFIGSRPPAPGAAPITVNIVNVTLQHGTGFVLSPGFPTGKTGGAIVNTEGSSLVLESVKVIESEARQGGGIANLGTLILRRSTVSANRAPGTGLNASGGAGITNGQRDLVTVDVLGQLGIRSSVAIIEESTVSGNIAGKQGGGITNFGRLDIKNSTISGNIVTGEDETFPQGGGGIFNSGGQVALNNVTIVENRNRAIKNDAGGGGVRSGGFFTTPDISFSFANTIIANND